MLRLNSRVVKRFYQLRRGLNDEGRVQINYGEIPLRNYHDFARTGVYGAERATPDMLELEEILHVRRAEWEYFLVV